MSISRKGPTLSAVALAVLTPPLATQDFTSPEGYLAREGNGVQHVHEVIPFNNYHTQIDATQIGSPRSGIHTLAWRRDGLLPARPSYAGGPIDIEVRMGHAHWPAVQHGVETELSALLREPSTTVLPATTVVLPSWEHAPGAPPAAFDASIPLAAPFSYDGTAALMWQAEVSSSPFLQYYPADALVGHFGWTAPTHHGTGCLATGAAAPMVETSSLRVWGGPDDTEWHFDTENAPWPLVNVYVAVGLQNPNLQLGACARILSSHDVVLLKGVAIQGLLEAEFTFPHNAAFVGQTFYVQSYARDAAFTVPYAFSQGVEQVYPAPPAGPAPQFAYGLAELQPPTAWPTTVTLSVGHALVTRLSDG